MIEPNVCVYVYKTIYKSIICYFNTTEKGKFPMSIGKLIWQISYVNRKLKRLISYVNGKTEKANFLCQ